MKIARRSGVRRMITPWRPSPRGDAVSARDCPSELRAYRSCEQSACCDLGQGNAGDGRGVPLRGQVGQKQRHLETLPVSKKTAPAEIVGGGCAPIER